MLVDISGSRCISCAKYTQYYAQRLTRSGPELSAIDCGFCGQLQRTTRPGSRCKHYREVSNVGPFYRIVKENSHPRKEPHEKQKTAADQGFPL